MTASDEVRLIVERIASRCKPKKIILFGSMARGDAGRGSDIDLLVVKESDKKRPFRVKEIFEAVRGMDRALPLDPIVYTPKELELRLKMGDFFVNEAVSQGRVMYAS